MKIIKSLTICFALVINGLFAGAQAPTIVYHQEDGDLLGARRELLAAKDLQRYLYVRTGKLSRLREVKWEMQASPGKAVGEGDANGGPVIIIGTQKEIHDYRDSLGEDDFSLYSSGKEILIITGGSSSGLLYGVYKFLESTGIGFGLDGDIIPDEKMAKVNLDGFHKVYRPAFALRGIQPFHDFAEGPDWWNEDDYKAMIAQLPKMGLNFIGLHTYPENAPFGGWAKAEPLVWIGMPDQYNADGSVKSAYPAMHANTGDSTWDYYPVKTGQFSCGASQLFDADVYGADYMKNVSPWPHSDAENKAIFDRVGRLLNGSFTLASQLAVRTCVGTETPLTIPGQLRARLVSGAANAGIYSDSVREKLYEGIFSRIKATHPLDYYWFWTPEGWTWEGEKGNAVEETERDLRDAITAANKVKAPFTLATCGWVLGPARNRAEFDSLLPKQMPFGVINRQTGSTPVEPAFAQIRQRPKWQISWMEDDPGLTAPQFWAGRTLKDAFDAYRYGCTGFMGIHWRTRNLSPAFMALARAGWEAASFKMSNDSVRDYPADSLYFDWAGLQFGKSAAAAIAPIFAGIDGTSNDGTKFGRAKMPRPVEWGLKGPGMISINRLPWATVEKNFDFIGKLEQASGLVRGVGNRARFQYWMEQFYYTRSLARLGCILGQLDTTAAMMKKTSELSARRDYARELIKWRDSSAQCWTEMMTHLLQAVGTTGEMGTVANLEEHSRQSLRLLNLADSLIETVTGKLATLPITAGYRGRSRLVMTTCRNLLDEGEDLMVPVRVLSRDPVNRAVIYWRRLGEKGYHQAALEHVVRGVYQARIRHSDIGPRSLEYHILVKAGANQLRYPLGDADQTVVVSKL